MNIEQELAPKLKAGIKRNEPMSKYTSWQVGGPADYYLKPAGLAELSEIISFRNKHQLPLFIFGNGTNLLVLDGGIRGLVVHIGEAFSYIRYRDDLIEAGAGTSVTGLAREAASRGLGGIEFTAGIPGSLGGAVIMNAGAFGGHIGECVDSVQVIGSAGAVCTLGREELVFGYRTSNLPEKGIVTQVCLQAEKCDPEESLQKIEYFMAERRRRHPALASAGSVFRNLTDRPAGKLIENAGGKGMCVGGAQVSEQHANFIINRGDASAADILRLIEKVRNLVKEKYGVGLKPEVRIVGEE